VKYPYKAFPRSFPDPVNKQDFCWRPAIRVILWHNHRRSAPLEAILDTGADHCIFNSEVGDSLGVPVTRGVKVPISGFLRDAVTTGFLHTLSVTIAAQTYDMPIVFVHGISAIGILGQIGFFDQFVATFDWTPNPPFFDLQRIQRN
jgi:aspartyl protease